MGHNRSGVIRKGKIRRHRREARRLAAKAETTKPAPASKAATATK
jgi:hypothetical protein